VVLGAGAGEADDAGAGTAPTPTDRCAVTRAPAALQSAARPARLGAQVQHRSVCVRDDACPLHCPREQRTTARETQTSDIEDSKHTRPKRTERLLEHHARDLRQVLHRRLERWGELVAHLGPRAVRVCALSAQLLSCVIVVSGDARQRETRDRSLTWARRRCDGGIRGSRTAARGGPAPFSCAETAGRRWAAAARQSSRRARARTHAET